MNFARLNHILIPSTKSERDTLRKKKMTKVAAMLFFWWFRLSDEGRFLVFFWLVASALALPVGTTQFYFLWSATTGLLAASFLFRRLFPLRDVSLRVKAPERAMVGEKVIFDLEVTNHGQTEYHSIRITGPFLPWDGKYESSAAAIKDLLPKQTCRITSSARFSARGEHHLDVFEANALVPLGMAIGPSLKSSGVRFLVVPRIANVSSVTTPVQARYQPGGVALASRTGESREILGIRPYQPGDRVRDIHVKSWARLRVPVVREYRQEYFTRIGIVVDTDTSGASEEQFEAALSLGAGLVSHLSRGEALIDLLVLGEDVHQLSLGRSLGYLEQALDLLACVDQSESFNRSVLESRMTPYLERLSSILFVTFSIDESRKRFVEWVDSNGVVCTVLNVVLNRENKGDSFGQGATILTVDEINSKNELEL